jgi:hypothetical protein
MVDVSYQMVLSTLQTVALLVGIFYYVMTLQNTRKNQQLQLETRQAQLFSQFALHSLSGNAMDEYIQVLNMEWKNYEDFEKKYGHQNNPEAFAMRHRVWGYFAMLGKLVREGLIDIDLVYTIISDSAIFQWYKWKDLLPELVKQFYTPDTYSDWEYLVNELMKRKAKLGYDSWVPPETALQLKPS